MTGVQTCALPIYAGRPVGWRDPETGEVKHDIVSLHQPTNRLVGIPVEAVRNMFIDRDTGEYRRRQIYGAEITPQQADALAEGKAVKIDGKTKEGQSFTAFVQFDATKRRVVPCHPAWLKEAQKAGVDLGLGTKKEAPAKSATKEKAQKAAETVQKTRTPKMKV